MLRSAEPLARRVDQRVLDVLPSNERERFIAALVSIVDTLQVVSSHTSQQR